jgi:hypothetical protein
MKAEKFEIESDRLSRISHPEQLAAPIGRAASLFRIGFRSLRCGDSPGVGPGQKIDTLVGDCVMEASMIRRPSIPLTRKSGVTTDVGSSALPIRQVPTG